MKYKWKVASAPTGSYRSFERRAWPSCYYSNGAYEPYAGHITCSDEYIPSSARAGTHAPLIVYVADYSITPTKEHPCPWSRRRLLGTFASLKEAYAAFAETLRAHPEILPKEGAL